MGESPYQDLVDAGGLEAVLRAACPGSDIEMQESRGAFGGFLAVLRERDRGVQVLPLVGERLFRVRHSLRGRYLSLLSTTDLAEVTGVAAAWVGGATARELAAAWPFADFADFADAYERGDRTEMAWQALRTCDWLRLGEFVEAAMREPRLRRMYPVTSVMMMSFQPAPDERRVPGLWVRGATDGRVTVFAGGRREEPGFTYDAAEAVRVCLAEIDRLAG